VNVADDQLPCTLALRRQRALFVIGMKFGPALPTLRILLPFRYSVTLAAFRTTIPAC